MITPIAFVTYDYSLFVTRKRKTSYNKKNKVDNKNVCHILYFLYTKKQGHITMTYMTFNHTHKETIKIIIILQQREKTVFSSDCNNNEIRLKMTLHIIITCLITAKNQLTVVFIIELYFAIQPFAMFLRHFIIGLYFLM